MYSVCAQSVLLLPPISEINNLVKNIILKEKKRKTVIKNQGATQSYNNFHFVYDSNSSKNKQILRLNNPQNRHKVFYELSRDKRIISIAKKQGINITTDVALHNLFLTENSVNNFDTRYKVKPPLTPIQNPSNNKTIISLIELVKKMESLLAGA